MDPELAKNIAEYIEITGRLMSRDVISGDRLQKAASAVLPAGSTEEITRTVELFRQNPNELVDALVKKASADGQAVKTGWAMGSSVRKHPDTPARSKRPSDEFWESGFKSN